MRNCTTHSHACDCREYGFEMMKKENEALKKDNKLLQSWVKHHQASAQNAINEKSKLQKENEELRKDFERIKGVAQENYNRAEKINETRTEEIKKLQKEIMGGKK